MSGVEGYSPLLSLGDSKGVFSSEREHPFNWQQRKELHYQRSASGAATSVFPFNGVEKQKCTLNCTPSSCYDETIIEKVRTLPMILSEAIQSLMDLQAKLAAVRSESCVSGITVSF